MIPRKRFSRYISDLMDNLGYNKEMIKKRQEMWQESDQFTTGVAVGSRGEGTTLLFESDLHMMFILPDVICADNPHYFIHKRNITLFHIGRGDETPAGYTRLKLVKNKGSLRKEISQSMFTSETGSAYLSSQLFNESIRNKCKNITFHGLILEDQQGPSCPLSGCGVSNMLRYDMVGSLKCHCPKSLDRWVYRPRKNGWPSSDLIHAVSLQDGHVVPVGSKGSENMYREWRICFTLAELHLIRNFNETQTKVYILLKKICQSVLNPVCKEMTSYIMENVVFWICEANGSQRFTDYHLIDRLFDCILYLSYCTTRNFLPNYMIPERNLLAGILKIEQRHRLVSVLGDLLHEGGRMLLRCDRIRDAMLVLYREPELFQEFCKKRDELEIYLLNQFKESMQELWTEENINFEFDWIKLIPLDVFVSFTKKIETEEGMMEFASTMLKEILS